MHGLLRLSRTLLHSARVENVKKVIVELFLTRDIQCVPREWFGHLLETLYKVHYLFIPLYIISCPGPFSSHILSQIEQESL